MLRSLKDRFALLFYRFIIFMARHWDRYQLRLQGALIVIKNALEQESKETKEMLEIYLRFTQGRASKEEMAEANHQFRDVLRAIGLGAFAILPFAPLSIPFIVKLGKYFGIEILPSSFRKKAIGKKDIKNTDIN